MAQTAKSRLVSLARTTREKLTTTQHLNQDHINQPTNQSSEQSSFSPEGYHPGQISPWKKIHPISEKSFVYVH
jgi:hypothetical protein